MKSQPTRSIGECDEARKYMMLTQNSLGGTIFSSLSLIIFLFYLSLPFYSFPSLPFPSLPFPSLPFPSLPLRKDTEVVFSECCSSTIMFDVCYCMVWCNTFFKCYDEFHLTILLKVQNLANRENISPKCSSTSHRRIKDWNFTILTALVHKM